MRKALWASFCFVIACLMQMGSASSPVSARQNSRLNNKLIDAALTGDEESMVRLLGQGADPDATVSVYIGSRDTVTALEGYYFWNPDSPSAVNVTRLFISHGVNVNARTRVLRETPLWLATVTGNEDAIPLLLAHGANINATNKKGQTILMMAAGDGQNKDVQLLLDDGANINIRAKDGSTALSFATSNNRPETVALLKAAGAR
jgi:ankyrin repeat protein